MSPEGQGWLGDVGLCSITARVQLLQVSDIPRGLLVLTRTRR